MVTTKSVVTRTIPGLVTQWSDITIPAAHPSSSVPDAPERARAAVRENHAALVSAVAECADAVAASWNGDSATDREAVAPPLRAALGECGALVRAPAALANAADAADLALPAEPVAAPPYVVVTSRGLVLRATADDARLVVTLVAFAVERDAEADAPTRYVRADDRVEAALRYP
jgi:hypothetical protein